MRGLNKIVFIIKPSYIDSLHFHFHIVHLLKLVLQITCEFMRTKTFNYDKSTKNTVEPRLKSNCWSHVETGPQYLLFLCGNTASSENYILHNRFTQVLDNMYLNYKHYKQPKANLNIFWLVCFAITDRECPNAMMSSL